MSALDPSASPVAIVGIGCLFPKSPDLASYWRNILSGRDCITDLPADHSWTTDDYFDADPSAPDKTWCTKGGFLEKLPFDPLKYGIPPAMLESIDTAQLLSLVVAREALRDAGIDPDAKDWNRDRVSVIIGITGTQEMAITAGSRLQGPIWRKSMLRCGVDPALVDVIVGDIANHFPTWTEQTFPGLLGNVVAGRIANRLDLGGTNAVVDAACASSLAAMQYAIADLLAGRSDVVLTGGADTLNDIFMFECFTRTPAFSKIGDARPFDAAADGILIGEGIAITALKRLADAERDGDRIYAVIRGLGSSSDGRHKSIYAPNPDGQVKALQRTYAMAGIAPETIELVEAHGTGTKAGDAAEIEALKRVYGAGGKSGSWTALGSVKSQIGHTKSTAGAAGLVKVALALHQRVIPPAAKIGAPNPKMGFETSPFYLARRARPWIRGGDHPRRAAVSAFGFGGSNFHAVLEEHGPDDVAADCPADADLFLFGADSVESVLAALQACEGPTVAHASRASLSAWQARGTGGSAHVVAFVATSLEDLAERRAVAARRLAGEAARPRDAVWVGGGSHGPIAFLFPGQGSQYVEMGRGLAIRHPSVRRALSAADDAFVRSGAPALSSRTFPPSVWTDDAADAQVEALRDTQWAQPAIGALSKGMLDLLAAFGVRPAMVAGHSYGELVALHAAGVFGSDTLWSASRDRGRLMSDGGGDRGTMMAVDGAIGAVEAAVAPHDVTVANRNHPSQSVLSGSRDAIAAAARTLAAAGFTTKALPVGAAFHSPLVAPARDPFRASLEAAAVRPATVPVFSCTTGAPYPTDASAVRDQLANQIVAPVDWVGTVDGLHAAGARIFVEVGPRGVLAGLTEKCLGARPGQVVALDRAGDQEDGDTQFKRALCVLAAAGVAIDVAPLLAEREPPTPPRADGPATVWLAGANHRNPSTLEPPMPKLPERPAHPSGPSGAATGPQATSGWLGVPSTGRPMEAPIHLERDVRTAPASLPTPGASATPAGGDLFALLESTRATLAAFQETQAKTADVHAQFLATFAKANDNFARLFEAQTRLVERVAAGGSMPREVVAPVVPTAIEMPTPVAPAPMGPLFGHGATSNPIDALFEPGRVPTPRGDRPSVATDLPPIFDARAAVEQRQAPAASSAPRAPRANLSAAVLAAVAEKTGYPLSALEPSMDLESDLGIDSIKRVEILSAVRERVPGLPEVDNDRLSALRTLADVIGVLEGGTAHASDTVRVARGPGRGAVVEAMLEAVAAKTGYPRASLELGMDLESDLGVDSIKRVEILSAVREAVPGLPEIENERLSALRTLSDVVDVLASAVASPPVPAILVTHNPPTRGSLVNALLDAVASKTGYPRASLDLTMALDSDLGVDSIKRVEILSAVRETLPSLPELDNEVLSSLRTLTEVADHLSGVAAGFGFALIGDRAAGAHQPALLVPPPTEPQRVLPEPALPPVQAGSEVLGARPARDPNPSTPVSLRRRSVVVGPAPEGEAFRGEASGRWLITADPGGLVHRVAEALRARGLHADVLDPDWAAPAFELPAQIVGVVHLAAVGATGSELRRRVRGAFLLAKATGPVPRFVTVSARGGAFAQADATGEPLQGALAGLPKTLAKEWLGTAPLALDIDVGIDPVRIAQELLLDRGVVEVGLSENGTVTLLADPFAPRIDPRARVDEDARPLPLVDGDLVVVTGGARGVTAACVLALSRQVHVNWLLIGRSVLADEPNWAVGTADADLVGAAITSAAATGQKLRPRDADALCQGVRSGREVRRTLAALAQAGGAATYAAVDGRDRAAVKAAIDAAVAIHGPVRGVIHGAGVLADKAVVDKTAEQFDRVFSTKVDGFDALMAAVDPQALRLAVAFTSVAGRFGNAGQCDYAMANEALVHALAALPATCATKAFDWGPWDGGMVDAGLKAHFEAAGHGVIPLAVGAAAFVAELSRSGREVVFEGPRPERGSVAVPVSARAPWLRDHVIADRPVVPVAMVLEWFVDAALQVAPGSSLACVRGLRVLKGIVLPSDGHTLTLAWEPAQPEAGETRAIALELRGPPTEGRPLLHYRATVGLAPVAPTQPDYDGPNGLARDRYATPIDQAYANFLFHGPTLQGLSSVVGTSDGGAIARMNSSAPIDFGVAQARWCTDPLVVDSALQLLLLWVREKHGTAALPTAIGRYRQHGSLAGPLECHLRTPGAGAQGGRFSAAWVDATGALVATLSDGEYSAGASLVPAFRQARA